MKMFSDKKDLPPLDRPKAWSYLVTNLFVLPGLGSFMARRVFAGCMQMLLAISGFAITFLSVIRFVVDWAQAFELPEAPDLYRSMFLGFAIFLAGWVWSIITSITLFPPRDSARK